MKFSLYPCEVHIIIASKIVCYLPSRKLSGLATELHLHGIFQGMTKITYLVSGGSCTY